MYYLSKNVWLADISINKTALYRPKVVFFPLRDPVAIVVLVVIVVVVDLERSKIKNM